MRGNTIAAFGMVLIVAITLWWLTRVIQALTAFLPQLREQIKTRPNATTSNNTPPAP